MTNVSADSHHPSADDRGAATRANVRALATAWLFYAALTIWHTWPLARHLGDRLPHDAGDPALNAWLLWWNATTRPLSDAWWDGLGFFPTGGTIAFSEHLLGLAWLTTPIMAAGGSPALAYNIAFLLSFALSAWTAHVLVWRLTGRHDAGLLAGLAFAFTPLRAGHLSHLQVLTTYWMPAALLGLHEFWRTRRVRWLALFAAAWLLQALSNNYYALFLSVLVALWLAWFGFAREAWTRLAAAAAASVVAAAALLPIALRYVAIHAEHGVKRGLNETAIFSADLAAFVNAPRRLWLWGWLQTEDWAERELFAGVTGLALVVLAVVRARSRTATATAPDGEHAERHDAARLAPRSRRWLAPARRLLAGLGAVAVLLAVVVWTQGQERMEIAGVTISTRHPEKPMLVGVVLLGVAAMLTPAAWRPFRRRTVFGFYVTGWVACLVLSLGPELRLFETTILYRTPYALLFALVPGFDGVRAPARFTILAALCLSVAAALAFTRLVRPDHGRRRLLVALAAAALIVEGAVSTLPMASLPEAVPQLASARGVILELPFGDAFTEAGALFRTSTHGHRLANGYSGFEPLFYRALRDGVALKDVDTLHELQTLAPITVLIDRARDGDGAWQALVTRAGGAPVAADAGWAVLALPQRDRQASSAPGRGAPIAVATVTATVQAGRAGALVDGNSDTGWGSDRPQQVGDAIAADLGAIVTIGSLELDQGRRPLDVPIAFEVETSEDGVAWTQVWRGGSAVQAMRAARVDPRIVRLHATFAPQRARHVRVRLAAASAATPWHVAELRVFEPAR